MKLNLNLILGGILAWIQFRSIRKCGMEIVLVAGISSLSPSLEGSYQSIRNDVMGQLLSLGTEFHVYRKDIKLDVKKSDLSLSGSVRVV